MAVQGFLWLAMRYPSTIISVFLTRFSYFLLKWLSNCPHEVGWTPFQILTSRKISLVKTGIEPGTSWMTVRRVYFPINFYWDKKLDCKLPTVNYFLIVFSVSQATVVSHKRCRAIFSGARGGHLQILIHYLYYYYYVHCCGASASMRACHEAGPGSIPGRDKFPGWGFFGGFPDL